MIWSAWPVLTISRASFSMLVILSSLLPQVLQQLLALLLRPCLADDRSDGEHCVVDAAAMLAGVEAGRQLLNIDQRFSLFASCRYAGQDRVCSFRVLTAVEHPDIPENAIPLEEAYAIAAKRLGKESYRVFPEPLIGTDTNPVWKISMSTGENNYSFEIDCITGEIRTQRLLGDGDYSWWKSWVLWEVSDEVEENWMDTSPSFG